MPGLHRLTDLWRRAGMSSRLVARSARKRAPLHHGRRPPDHDRHGRPGHGHRVLRERGRRAPDVHGRRRPGRGGQARIQRLGVPSRSAVSPAVRQPRTLTARGTINLNLNTANAANGDIVLGIWNGSGFTPSLDGTQVNAVLCRYSTQVPMSFLRLLGLNSLTGAAEAIAWAPPPATPPPTSCIFPVAVSSCFFNSGGSGATSSGCGATIQFTSSSDQSQLGANTAAWVSLDPNANNVNANDTKSAVDAAASGTCGASPIQTGRYGSR